MDTPLWLSDIHYSPAPQLQTDTQADVLIIGSGLTGVSAAYFLSTTGKKVIVIDKADISKSTTAYTTAFITYMIDTPLSELIHMFGIEKAQMVWESGNKAIQTIEDIVHKEKIDCEFMRCSEYLYALKKDDLRTLEKEYTAAKTCDVRLVFHKGDHALFSDFGYLEFPKQAKFHPLKYLLALRHIAAKNGVGFFDNTEALSIKGADPIVITTPKGTIHADKALIVTYDPFNHPLQLFGKKGIYNTYVLAGQIPKGQLHEGLYLDTQNPYHYIRVDSKEEYDQLIIGGEDQRHEVPTDDKKQFAALSTYLHQTFSGVAFRKTHQWKGFILESTDGLAYIGRMDENRWVAMAFSGNGMTYATIAGLMARDFVLGEKNPWEELYDPLRTPNIYQLFEKGKDYIEEFFNGAVKNTL